MPRPVPILTGDIVTLRPIDPQRDAEDYYQWNLEPEVHVWTGDEILASAEEARQELERFTRIDDLTMWAIIDNVSGEMVGRFFVCLEKQDGKLVAGEGNRIAKQYWRQGHNREARGLVMDYVFSVLEADCIETQCWMENTNSLLSIKAHGFTLVEEKLAYNSKYHQSMKRVTFRMTRQEWMQRKQGDKLSR